MTGAARGTGTKLAVVGAVAEDSDITEAVSGIVLVYIENAFVETELYQVLERRNLDAILEEQEFMLSDLVDEESLVKIGNLAGAELVGIAELSEVDGVYYINIRLVETESGKIKASSMAESDDFRRLFGMCSQAVEQLH
jgi:curli biogenesis system outer membrane secretion channel CsgG